jgi:hypothetical protein
MTLNVGGLDRTARVVVGIILITLAALQIISPWGWLGIILVVTGTSRHCPAYSLFGVRTCKK